MSEIKKALDEGLAACEELFERDYFGNHNVQTTELTAIKERFANAVKAYEKLKDEAEGYEAATRITQGWSMQIMVINLNLRDENAKLKESFSRLNGLYHSEVSKHQLDYIALKAENEALRKQVDDHKEWHMMRDEMRKALEAQMNGDSK